MRHMRYVNDTAIPSQTRPEIEARMDHFHDTVLSANWGDYYTLIQDVHFLTNVLFQHSIPPLNSPPI